MLSAGHLKPIVVARRKTYVRAGRAGKIRAHARRYLKYAVLKGGQIAAEIACCWYLSLRRANLPARCGVSGVKKWKRIQRSRRPSFRHRRMAKAAMCGDPREECRLNCRENEGLCQPGAAAACAAVKCEVAINGEKIKKPALSDYFAMK